MRVLVTGANGLIGGYVTARLLADGHAVVGVGRDTGRARRRMPSVEWLEVDLARMTAEGWRTPLAGVDAVVNCAGALQDGPRDDLAAVHHQGVLALARACEAAGVRRFVQVSAAGAAEGGGRFNATKRAADDALAALDLDWTVLRPTLVLAPAAYGGSALLRGLAAFPLAIPLIHAEAIVQTVSVEDVAEAVVRCAAPDGPARIVCDLTAAEPTRLRDVVLALRDWLGLTPAPVWAAPPALGRLGALAADALAWLGWRSPMRSAAIDRLGEGVVGRAGDATRLLGFTPRSLRATLAAWPSSVQERWFAKLYFVKPSILATLAAFWAVSGLIGFLQREPAAALLTATGMAAPMAMSLTLGGAALDLLVGLAICGRRTAPAGLLAALAMTVAYLAGGTLFRPDLWADPLGPLVKTLPAAALALVALAVMDER